MFLYRFWNQLALFALLAVLACLPARAQVCAPSGSLVTGPTNGIVNNYYQGNGTLNVGATSLTLGTRDTRGANNAIATGDLLLIIQIQDASFVSANNSTYGNGTGSGQGSTSVGGSGLHEFVRVTGGTAPNLTFTPPLSNSYFQANAAGATPQKRYQVVRVMQYSSLTANGLTTPSWNGLTGGIVAVDVRDGLVLGSGTVEGQPNIAFFAAGKGFRGGAGRGLGDNGGSRDDYMTAATANYNASKGEGIAGAPYYIANLTSVFAAAPAITLVTAAPGYPGGSSARGAPGNAGGGGSEGNPVPTGGNNSQNAGGGGGGNHGPGGIGGRPWNRPLEDTGGRGGAGYAGTLDFNRIFLGGGGGAGATNDSTSDNNTYTNKGLACTIAALCSSGAPGGGIVMIRARTISGGGTIDVRGAYGYNVGNDAAGGGGGGGGVIMQTTGGGNATIDASGGDGGNAWAGQPGGLGERHGPGGAGGGGFIAFSPSTMSVIANVDGGVPGETMSNLTPDEHYGSMGYNGGITTFLTPNTPGVVPAAQCEPSLSLSKSNGVSSLSSPGTTTYSLTVLNTGNGASVGTVTVADKLPAGLSVAPGALAVTGPNAASWTCTAANATDILCRSASSISGGASSTFSVEAAVGAANGTSLINRAQVSGGADPLKPTPGDPVAGAAACTANNTPAGCALDTDTVLAPNLGLTKTNGVTSLVRGATSSYTVVVSNEGGTATTGAITMLDVLPTGLSLANTAGFTVNSFSCTSSGTTALSCVRTAALPANGAATITFTVLAGANAPSSVTNRARVGGGGDPSTGKQTAPTATTVATCAAPVAPATTASDINTGCASDTDEVRYVSLSLSKSDGTPFMSTSGSVDYVFVVRNTGTAPSAGSINVRDVLPAPMTFPNPLVATDLSPGWTCTRVNATEATCTSTTSIAAGGSATFTLRANVNATTDGTGYINKARVGGGGDVSAGMVTTPTTADVQACIAEGDPSGCAIDLNTAQTAPRIRLSKSHPDPQSRSPGDSFNFTLVVSNTGGSNAGADTVRVIDDVPAGLTINTVTPSTGMACTTTAPVIQCRNSTALNAGTTRSVVVNVTVATTAFPPLVNEAKAAGSGDPQNTGPLTTDTAALTIVRACVGTDAPSYGCAVDSVPLNADLQITKRQRVGTGAFAQTLASSVPIGGTIQFAIDVVNSGPSRVTGALVIDTVPTNFSTVTWICGVTNNGTGGGTATSCGGTTTGSGNAISLTTGLIRPTGSLRITVTAVAAYASGLDGVTNTATVTPPDGITEGTPGNNEDSVSTRIGAANLSITKSNGVNTVTSGLTTTYTITLNNSGNFPADGSRLYDPAVPGLSCTLPPTCVATGAATSCPASLTAAQIQNGTAPTGVAIPTFGPGGSLTLSYTCTVSATGQ